MERILDSDGGSCAQDFLCHNGGGLAEIDEVDVTAQFFRKVAGDLEALNAVDRGGG